MGKERASEAAPARLSRRLDAAEIQRTVERLCLRIDERFPGSGLGRTCRTLLELSSETGRTVRWISRPHHLIRWGTVAIIALLAAIAAYSVCQLRLTADGINIADFVQMTEAAVSELVLIGAGAFFLVTFEARRRRGRVVSAVSRLKCLAHIIDAHQLTKDPDCVGGALAPTAHSPRRRMTEDELGRYLDYCSEMLSLASKLGFLYVQDFDDPVASAAVNELENLTNGLSRQIWQKIMIVHARGGAAGLVQSPRPPETPAGGRGEAREGT
jgi:hypothetical protein